MKAPADPVPALEGRWHVFVCTGCGECTGRHQACDAERRKTPVVPCDPEAVERVAAHLGRRYFYVDWAIVDEPTRDDLREAARDILTTAGVES